MRTSPISILRRTLPALFVLVAAPAVGRAQGATPRVYHACYVPSSGTVYRIRETGVPQECRPLHVAFSWTDATGFTDPVIKPGDAAQGDLAGTYPAPTVVKLNGTALATATPTTGQVLTFDGTNWSPATPPAPAVTTEHGALTGLADDDHPQYLRADGTRVLTGSLAAGGFTITNLGAATANGDAVRYEQAVKVGDTVQGDLSGSWPSPTVARLQGTPVRADAPLQGQVLAYRDGAWAGTTLTESVNAHGALSGLGADDHPHYLIVSGARNAIDGFAVTGTSGSGVLVASGPGTRLVWYPRKGAFRAGTVSGTQWDDASIGATSTAFGNNATASNTNTIAMGGTATASGINAIALGANATASGAGAVAMGGNANASGLSSMALGSGTVAIGPYATALGQSTSATTTGAFAAGGSTTAAGQYSTALGSGTVASGDYSTALGSSVSTGNLLGSFIIGDRSTTAVATSNMSNQFMARFAGGYTLYSNAALSTGAWLPAGGGSWAALSDVRKKTAFLPVDGAALLAKIAAMPVQTWQYRSQEGNIRHMGPTAQDFHRAFGLGESDTTITGVDADGVALAAVKALEERTRALQAENAALRDELAALRRSVLALQEARRPATAARQAGDSRR